jgi:hypothetical protein
MGSVADRAAAPSRVAAANQHAHARTTGALLGAQRLPAAGLAACGVPCVGPVGHGVQGFGDAEPATRRYNPAQGWVVSDQVAHVGLVSEEDFIAVQAVRAMRPTGDGNQAHLPADRAAAVRAVSPAHGRALGQQPARRCRTGVRPAIPAQPGDRRVAATRANASGGATPRTSRRTRFSPPCKQR